MDGSARLYGRERERLSDLVPLRVVGRRLVLGLRDLGLSSERDRAVRVGSSSPDLGRLDASCAADGELEDSDGSICE